MTAGIISVVGLDGITSLVMVTSQIRFDLATLFLPLYCGLYMLGLFMVSKYRIDRELHNKNLDKLATRHDVKSEDSPASVSS